MSRLLEGSSGGRRRSGRCCLTPFCLKVNAIYVNTSMRSFPEHLEGEVECLYIFLRGILEAMWGDDRVAVCQCGGKYFGTKS